MTEQSSLRWQNSYQPVFGSSPRIKCTLRNRLVSSKQPKFEQKKGLKFFEIDRHWAKERPGRPLPIFYFEIGKMIGDETKMELESRESLQ